ncbi:hypothetical protein [Paenibacillus sambharensis]|nr:hypothetical protein [Paenibacillus sambharensis]
MICYDIRTGNRLGELTIRPIEGEKHYFGGVIFVCRSCGEIALFEQIA